MLSVGKTNELTVCRIEDAGAYLTSDKGEILLPKEFLLETVQVGDLLDVFVYNDYKGQLMATTTKPYAEVDDVASLEVVDVNDTGAFLDWGMPKDLLLPYSLQLKRISPGQKCVVKLILDEKSGRVIASSKLGTFLEFNDGSLKAGSEVTALFFDASELGFSAIVNDKFLALLHRQDATGRIEFGTPQTIYVKRTLPDGKIELSLRKVGYEAVVASRVQLIEALESADGFLPYTDKSSPDEIMTALGMSKKAFKRVTGALYKDKKITLDDDGIRLVHQDK